MLYDKQDTSAAADGAATQPFRWHYAEFDDGNFQIRGSTLFLVVALFSVILLVALLCLYVRWVCRFTPPPPSESAVPTSARTANLPSKGLDAASIKSLPVVLYRRSSSDSGDGECCICLGVLGDGDKVKVLPDCGHCFDPECVDRWLMTQSKCPLCRAWIGIDSPV